MPSHVTPRVSILMPVRNEQDFLARTLETVFAQDFPHADTEILIIDGSSTDATPLIVQALASVHPGLRLLANPQRLQSFGLNLGIREARGDFIVRMDAHTLYAPDYVRKCVELLERGDAAEVGGVQRAIGNSFASCAIALAMSHPFGVGDARFRYTTREIYAETVYLGAWKRSTLLALGGFRNEVNEEGDLNFRLRQAGLRILVSPQIRLEYIVRQSLPRLARQYAWYGRAKMQTLSRYPDSLQLRQLAPPLLLAALLLSALLFPFSPAAALSVPAAYAAATLLASAHLARRGGWKYFPLLPVVFALMHLSWALGSVAGMWRFGVPRISLRSLPALLRRTFAARRRSAASPSLP